MTRDYALLSLLSIEPETEFRLGFITGWGEKETSAVLQKLVAEGKVGYRHGSNGTEGCRLYYTRTAQEGSVGALPAVSGARPGVRDVRGGPIREKRTLELGWFGAARAAGSGEGQVEGAR